jgi:hypothetical protein
MCEMANTGKNMMSTIARKHCVTLEDLQSKAQSWAWDLSLVEANRNGNRQNVAEHAIKKGRKNISSSSSPV